MPNGDVVEWDEDEDGKPILSSHIILRNAEDISKVCSELRDKVWWNRHQNWLWALWSGEETLAAGQEQVLKRAQEDAYEIERKYGKENLGWDDFAWGVLSGKMAALSWVLGAEWEYAM